MTSAWPRRPASRPLASPGAITPSSSSMKRGPMSSSRASPSSKPRSTKRWEQPMREFLEDAARHIDDGYGRAQKHVRQELPKRFYKEVGVGRIGDGYAVTLDGRS